MLSALAALLGLLGAGGYLYLRTSLPQTSGSIVLAGLEHPVEIVRDANAVPHIHAESARDAYFAVGYVHAQDRLWQMEFTRRLGAGRLAEILGEPGLKFDRFLRTLGLYRLAEKSYERLSPEVRECYDAYAAGVNAWLRARTGALPPEFLILGVHPEPWRPADSLVWGRLMAVRLGRNWRTEALRTRILEALADKGLERDRLDRLWSTPAGATPSTLESPRHAARMTSELLASIPTEQVSDGASNAWVLHGSRTRTGKPILANDPHLAFEAPILWYLAQVQAPGLSVTGATLPGAPVTVLGHNDHIAWGFTNGYGDNEDLFVETLDPGNPEAYLTADGPRAFETREEIIHVKGATAVTLRVRETYHGPVLSGVSDGAAKVAGEGYVIALSSPALRADDRTVEAVYAINRAGSWAEFRAAAGEFDTPHQNLMFASTTGDIGFIAAGRIPLRLAGDGRVPVSGRDGAHDWRGFIPPERMPQGLDPATGRFVNANNRSVPEDYPYLVTRDWPPPYRAERILERLDAMDAPDIDDMATLQSDVRSPVAERLLPLMLAFEPHEERVRNVMGQLSHWDREMRRERPEPLIFAAWLRQLVVALVEDELGPDATEAYLRDEGDPAPGLVESALTDDPRWCDDITTPEPESCAQVLENTLRLALDEITGTLGPDRERWRWGDVHRATFAHNVLTHVPVVRWLADLSIESDGGDQTVNRGQTARRRPGGSFAHVEGATLRAIYDLADLDNSRLIIPTGQSGNFLSPHYRDFLERWRDGDYLRIPRNPESDDRQSDTLRLVPGK